MRSFWKIPTNLFQTDFKTGSSGSIDFNLWLAQICGLPILGLKKETVALKVLLMFYGITTTIIVTCFYPCFEMYDLALSWPNLEDMTQNSCLSLTHVAGIYKIWNIFYRYADICRMIDRLKYLIRVFVTSPKERENYLKYESQNKIFLIGFASLVGFTGILGISLLQYDSDMVAGKIFPYRISLPKWLSHKVRKIYMGSSVLLIAVQDVAVDYLNITMINHIRFHLCILKLRFEELMISEESTENHSLQNAKNQKRSDPNLVLQKIIEHHCHLKRLCFEIEYIFRIPLLIQFAASLLIYVLTGFQATVSQGNAKSAIIIYLYCGCILIELFFYCWFGNEVFEQNKTLATTAYNSSWYKFDIRFRKSFLIFLHNAQQPVLFTAGGFINLFLPTFVGILGKTYSYIAVLRQYYGQST